MTAKKLIELLSAIPPDTVIYRDDHEFGVAKLAGILAPQQKWVDPWSGRKRAKGMRLR